MSLANKQEMSELSTITTLSIQDLVTFYNNFHKWLPIPSPLNLLKFYIDKKKPSHVFVDEAPLETSWCKYLARLPLFWVYNLSNRALLATLCLISTSLIAFVCRKPTEAILLPWSPFLLPGIALMPLGSSTSESTSNVALRHFISISVLALTFCSWLEAIFGTWSLRPYIKMLPCLWYLCGFRMCPFSLPKTASLLLSFPPMMSSSSSTIWLALHSVPLIDTMRGVDKSVTGEEVGVFRRMLAHSEDASLAFLSLPLYHNLRNSHTVANTQSRPGYDWGQHTKVLPIASPPPPPRPCLPPPRGEPPPRNNSPILIPVASKSNLAAAVAHAWECLGCPATLVTLLDNVNLLETVEDGFSQKNLSITSYFFEEDQTKCETFLENPSGVLITSGRLFSGMEAATVIWVTGSNREMDRSNKLRAVERLCIIDTDTRDTADVAGMKREKQFAKCQLPWPARVMSCKSCAGHPVLCPHCATVCHQDCQKEWNVSKFLLRLIFPKNVCTCKVSGKCKI